MTLLQSQWKDYFHTYAGMYAFCGTARHMPPLMRQVQAWRQPHLQNRSDPTKIGLPIYIKLRFLGNLPCMTDENGLSLMRQLPTRR